MYNQCLNALKEFYGYDSFRTGQWSVIESILKKNDTLAIMPTSAGKSVCYQVPALVSHGTCIVISPLIALMKDQVDQLLNRNIKAIAINSSLSKSEINTIYAKMDVYKFIYVSPERLKDKRFISRLSEISICFVAVDEAHCISQWGHEFRPAYREIGTIRKLVKAPFAALTATATGLVAKDIEQNLKMLKPNVIVKGFDRPNLKWIVLYEKDKLKKIKEICSKLSGSGIIYASTRKTVEDIFNYISKRTEIKVTFYHGGLDSSNRIKIQDAYIANEYDLLISTNAFGMGVDKPDVRFVIHYELAADLEAYYQEAGRAGRDGKNSYCILLYDQSDVAVHEYFQNRSIPKIEDLKKILLLFDTYQKLLLFEIASYTGIEEKRIELLLQFMLKQSILSETDQNYLIKSCDEEIIQQLFEKYEMIKATNQNRLNAMIEFCENRICRRNMILSYFGEVPTETNCGRCDICLGRNKSQAELKTEFIEIFRTVLIECKERFGVLTICDVLQGKQSDQVLKYRLYRTKYYANFNMFSRRYIIRLINELLDDRIVIRTKGKFPILKLNRKLNY